ncbi:primary active transporter [Lithospermum erythrorhizon]|uniref:Primary active transporter n=1 Tax=Lithospermum erythrorhizon TaxID=34254 RepID=A0AAV3PCS3_LITER
MATTTTPSVDNLPTSTSTPRSKKILNSLYVPHPSWKGAKLLPMFISIFIGLIVRFAIPKPHDVSKQGWQLLAIFLTTIAGLVLSPLPVGAWALICLTIAVITRTLTFAAAFTAFTNEVIWLIVISFFFSRGFVKTGLGDRIAMYFVRWLGKSTLGLSYGLVLSEAAISPAMPSTTARAGGVFLPIIKSLALGADSLPDDGTSRKIGAFLIQSQFQDNGVNSDNPLFLHSSDHSSLVLVSDPLTEKNYNCWSRAMTIALEGRDKYGFVNGEIPKPAADDVNYK